MIEDRTVGLGLMPRTFFFNRYVYPDHSATSQLLTDLAWHLAGQGSAVTLVGSRQRYDDASSDLPANEHVRGIDIVRVDGSRFGRNSLSGRLLDYASYLFGAARVMRKHVRSSDTVVLMTDPPLLGALLAPLAAWRGARCMHWLQDLFPEVAEVLLGRVVRRWVAVPLRWWRDRALRRATGIVVISAGMSNRVESLGVPRERIRVIENWADDEAICPLSASANPLRSEWDLAGKFVVGYSGNLGRAHDWQTMLEVATRLRDRTDIRFLLIGGGVGQHAFAAAAADRGLSSIEVRPYQSRDALAHSLTLPDLHWLSLQSALEGTILPSKLYGILAAGRPALFIGDPEGEVATRLRDTGAGLAAAVGDVEAASEAVCRLADDRPLAVTMGARGREWLETEGRRQQALQRWQAQLLVSTPPAE
ncbi:MAG: glycosyltransferase family 4 protein [Pseudomarimonas sp.]